VKRIIVPNDTLLLNAKYPWSSTTSGRASIQTDPLILAIRSIYLTSPEMNTVDRLVADKHTAVKIVDIVGRAGIALGIPDYE